MNLKELIDSLEQNQNLQVRFMLPEYDFVPEHFHVTEVGKLHKTFIDCGGTRREHTSCVLQVWTANDTEHRLSTGKLLKILKLAEFFESQNIQVEIEYGVDVSSMYVLQNIQTNQTEMVFILSGKKTDCLAPDKCGVTKCCEGGSC
jgi:hypothetical protein